MDSIIELLINSEYLADISPEFYLIVSVVAFVIILDLFALGLGALGKLGGV